jgi:hypothetical protein
VREASEKGGCLGVGALRAGACAAVGRTLTLTCWPQKHARTLEAEEAWRARYNKEERKKRYLEAGQAEKRAKRLKAARAD